MDLGQWIMMEGPLPPEQAVGWALRLAKTLERIHERGVVHGGISAEAIEAIDRDCSAPATLQHAEELLADPQYHSAERARGAAPSAADDVWAAGVFLYYAMTRAVPFAGSTDAAVASRIAWRPSSPIEVYDVFAANAQRVLDRVFARDRAKRITTAADLRTALCLCSGGDDELPAFRLSQGVKEALMEAGEARKGRASAPAEPPPDDESTVAPAASAVQPAEQRVRDRAGNAVGARTSREERRLQGKAARRDLAPWLVIVVVLGVFVYFVAQRDRGKPQVDVRRARPTARAPAPVPPLAGRRSTAPLETAVTARASEARGSASSPSTSATGLAPMADAAAVAVSASASTAQPRRAPTARVRPRRPASVRACVIQAFPEGTFANLEPGFESVCTTTDPLEGAEALRNRVVWARQGRLVTAAMREWSKLGWYDMAAFALIQGYCCPNPPELRAPVFVAPCKLDAALSALSIAAHGGKRKAIEDAVERYTAAVECAAHSGAGAYFRHDKPPTGSEPVIVGQIIERLGAR